MNILNVIEKKKNRKKLSRDEIDFFINSFVSGNIKDYQASSLLMAILLNGMDEDETSLLTAAMINSGEIVDLTSFPGIKCDKHSTGGIGDKTSIALVPLLASLGVAVAKMSGKGLGHTGGTLDKLEAIPGFKIEFSEEEFVDIIKNYSQGIISPTNNLVPADKMLYALRDVTGTVDSIPLIASSIMSKKLASGADTILLDVKVGNGAFMKDLNSAKELAKVMVSIGKSHGKDTRAIISDMNEPLGYAIGNSLEVIEAIETLKGNGPEDFQELVFEAATIILDQAGIEKDRDRARKKLTDSIESGRALESFKKLVEGQAGNPAVANDYSILPRGKFITLVKSPRDAYLKSINALELGLLSADLGAGRKEVGQAINYASGFVLKAKTADKINEADVLLEIHHDNELESDFIEKILNAYEFSNDKCEKKTLIYEIIN